MKKLLAYILVLACMLAVSGCNNRSMNNTIENEPKTTVSGSFTVTVRNVIPDYCMDDSTPNVAVVTEFQSYPFTLFVGEEIGKELVVGETYVFTINPIVVDDTKESLESMSLSSLVWELPGFEITDFRVANDNELGLESLRLTIQDESINDETEKVMVEETDTTEKLSEGEMVAESINAEDGFLDETIETEEGPVSIRVTNPSWEYYTAETLQSKAKPFELNLVEETANEIVDTNEWFEENELSYPGAIAGEEYYCIIEYDGTLVNVFKDDICIAVLDFTDYMYSPDYRIEDKDYVEEKVYDAKIKDGILYVSTFHYTYAASAPSNAYITAISLEDYSVIWKSQPLLCNSLNFEIVDDIIFCGYGFTEEDDYLYQIDRLTGTVLEKYKLMSKPDYIIYKEGKLYIRTYNTNYVMEVIH